MKIYSDKDTRIKMPRQDSVIELTLFGGQSFKESYTLRTRIGINILRFIGIIKLNK